MGGKGICVNEASQKIAKYSSSLSDLKTVAHSCKHAIIHVSSACNPMKRRRFPKQNDKKQSNFQENRQIAPTAVLHIDCISCSPSHIKEMFLSDYDSLTLLIELIYQLKALMAF